MRGLKGKGEGGGDGDGDWAGRGGGGGVISYMQGVCAFSAQGVISCEDSLVCPPNFLSFCLRFPFLFLSFILYEVFSRK